MQKGWNNNNLQKKVIYNIVFPEEVFVQKTLIDGALKTQM